MAATAARKRSGTGRDYAPEWAGPFAERAGKLIEGFNSVGGEMSPLSVHGLNRSWSVDSGHVEFSLQMHPSVIAYHPGQFNDLTLAHALICEMEHQTKFLRMRFNIQANAERERNEREL